MTGLTCPGQAEPQELCRCALGSVNDAAPRLVVCPAILIYLQHIDVRSRVGVLVDRENSSSKPVPDIERGQTPDVTVLGRRNREKLAAPFLKLPSVRPLVIGIRTLLLRCNMITT